MDADRGSSNEASGHGIAYLAGLFVAVAAILDVWSYLFLIDWLAGCVSRIAGGLAGNGG